jgi:hypothetical protein
MVDRFILRIYVMKKVSDALISKMLHNNRLSNKGVRFKVMDINEVQQVVIIVLPKPKFYQFYTKRNQSKMVDCLYKWLGDHHRSNQLTKVIIMGGGRW